MNCLLRCTFAFLIATLPMPAQAGQVADVTTGTITGVVQRLSGDPVAGVTVFVIVKPGGSYTGAEPPRVVSAEADDAGRYSLGPVPFGSYTVTVRGAEGVPGKSVRLDAAHLEARANFSVPVAGTISGRVLNPADEGVPGKTVFLLSQTYEYGILRYSTIRKSVTNERGEYSIQGVRPGRPFVLQVGARSDQTPAVSDAPEDIKLRPRIAVPTFYPNSSEPAGAVPVTISDGEHREFLDIRMAQSASFCIAGAAKAISRPDRIVFEVRDAATGIGTMGQLGTEGKLRICELTPGTYQVTLRDWQTPLEKGGVFSTQRVTVMDRDVQNVIFTPEAGLPVTVKASWFGERPKQVVADPRIIVAMLPVNHLPVGETPTREIAVPGEALFPAVPLDEYAIRPIIGMPGVYAKSIRVAGNDLTTEVFSIGSALGGSAIEIMLGFDCGSVSVRVMDRDDRSMANAFVTMVPVSAMNPAGVSQKLLVVQTNEEGVALFNCVPPGKYRLAATERGMEADPGEISTVMRLMFENDAINVEASSSVAVNTRLRASR